MNAGTLSSTPADKPVPVEDLRGRWRATPGYRKAVKRRHAVKARQWAKRLIRGEVEA